MVNRKGISALLLIAVLSTLFVSCSIYSSYKSSQMKPEGDKVIAKIEAYRKQNNRLPDSLNDLGIKESEAGPFYYKKESENRYVVWFGKELGESVTYDSATTKWDR